jgi:hypothetical protein
VLTADYHKGKAHGQATLRQPDGSEEVQIYSRGKLVRSVPKQRFEEAQKKRQERAAARTAGAPGKRPPAAAAPEEQAPTGSEQAPPKRPVQIEVVQ